MYLCKIQSFGPWTIPFVNKTWRGIFCVMLGYVGTRFFSDWLSEIMVIMTRLFRKIIPTVIAVD